MSAAKFLIPSASFSVAMASSFMSQRKDFSSTGILTSPAVARTLCWGRGREGEIYIQREKNKREIEVGGEEESGREGRKRGKENENDSHYDSCL